MLGDELDIEGVMAGKVTPVFFGSAMNNFGVELFLQVGACACACVCVWGGGGGGLHPPQCATLGRRVGGIGWGLKQSTCEKGRAC